MISDVNLRMDGLGIGIIRAAIRLSLVTVGSRVKFKMIVPGAEYGLCTFLLRVTEESALHLFATCREARKLWARLGVSVGVHQSSNISSWFFDCLRVLSDEKLDSMVMSWWELWNSRNESIWNGTPFDLDLLIQRAASFLAGWRSANELPQDQGNRQHVTKWKKPLHGRIKLNTDAALDLGSGTTGIGWVLRDEDGRFLAAKNVKMSGLFDVKVAEAIWVREALSWLMDTGMGSVDVETDSQLLFNALSCNSFLSDFGLVVDDIKELASLINDVEFGFVKRSANCAAHSVAREAFSESGCGEWFDIPPVFLADCLISDSMN